MSTNLKRASDGRRPLAFFKGIGRATLAVSLGNIILYFRGDDSDVNATFDAVERRAGQMGSRVGSVVTKNVQAGVSGIGGILQGTFSFLTGNVLFAALNTIRGAFAGLSSGMIGGNKVFEDYNVRFRAHSLLVK